MTSPSNHEYTAAKLHTRGISFEQAAAIQRPLDFDTEWQRFASVCGSQTTAQAAWNRLEPIISGVYASETAFDRALFECITTLLGNHVQKTHDNLFVLAGQLNIGLARQVDRKAHLGFGDSYGLTTDIINNHAIVLVDSVGNIVDETALVVLKTDATNCRSFSLCHGHGMVRDVNLSMHHGAFGQALIYVAGDLVNCLARRGIQEDRIEVVVVSGRRHGRTGEQRLCYVRGSLTVPKRCGGRFVFNILDYEGYETGDCGEHALAAYFHTLANGIERALRSTAQPLPLCGRVLQIGNREIPNATLVGSPIPRVTLDHNVNQGEIFRAPLADVVRAEHRSLLWMIDKTVAANLSEEAVLVKVSSRATHNLYVPPLVAFMALYFLHNNVATRVAVSDVLVGAWTPNPYSLVTITKELVGFEPVRPHSCRSLPNLWSGFVDLVETVLIPMAEAGVVHADVRIGWTETANILQSSNEDGTPPTLRLIDYESLCDINDLPDDPSGRTFQFAFDRKTDREDYTALRYLWWQCIFAAYMWTTQTDVTAHYDWRHFVAAFDNGTLDRRFWDALTANDQNRLGTARRAETSIVGATVRDVLRILNRIPALGG